MGALSLPRGRLSDMSAPEARPDPKATLHRYLRNQRDVLVWKLDGVSEYDARRPLTPTGTNLLGLVKHLATVESGYFGDTFGRPLPDPPAWFEFDDAAPNADMWATAEQSRAEIVDTYRRVCAHGDATMLVQHQPASAPQLVNVSVGNSAQPRILSRRNENLF